MNEYCSLVQDLLPLYVDGLVGADSARLIAQHLAQCSHCQTLYEAMRAGPQLPKTTIAQVKRPFRRIKQIYVTRTLLVLLGLIVLGALTVFKTNEWRGEGITVTSISGSWKAAGAFRALQQGDYESASRLFDDSRGTQEFIRAFQELSTANLVIQDVHAFPDSFAMSAGTVLGPVKIKAEYGADRYNLYFYVKYVDQSIIPLKVVQVYGPFQDGIGYALQPAAWPQWITALDQALLTELQPTE